MIQIPIKYPSLIHCAHIQRMLAAKRPVTLAAVITEHGGLTPSGGESELLFTLICRSSEDCGVCQIIEDAYPVIRLGRVPEGVLAVSPIEMDGVTVAEATTPASTERLPQ